MRCCEDNIEFNRTASEGVVGVASQHVHTLLLCRHNLVVALCYIAEDAEIDQCTACLVVAMHGKDILAFLEQVSPLAIKTNHHTIHIVHDACGSLLAIDVDFASIIVREDKVEVALQLASSQVNSSTYPNVIVLLRP